MATKTRTPKRPRRRTTTRTTKPTPTAAAFAGFLRLLVAADSALREQEPGLKKGEVPDIDVMFEAGRVLRTRLNPGPAIASQKLLRLCLGKATAAMRPGVDGRAIVSELVDGALEATEQLATRAGFLMGYAQGLQSPLARDLATFERRRGGGAR